jgi:para-nitrobenzyl esterase
MRRVLLAVLFLAFTSSETLALKVAIKTDQGVLNGETEDDVQVFKNIPFAAPPVGDLRWRAPQPDPNWAAARPNSVRSARRTSTSTCSRRSSRRARIACR